MINLTSSTVNNFRIDFYLLLEILNRSNEYFRMKMYCKYLNFMLGGSSPELLPLTFFFVASIGAVFFKILLLLFRLWTIYPLEARSPYLKQLL